MKLDMWLLAALMSIGVMANAQDAATSAEKPKTETHVPAGTAVATKSSAEGAKKGSKAVNADRLDLETTVVTGNRELPKVLYIVPWKRADIGELPAQPFNTLLDEMLQPVDRDVFKREVKYFHTVSSGVGKNGAAPAAAVTAPPVSTDAK